MTMFGFCEARHPRSPMRHPSPIMTSSSFTSVTSRHPPPIGVGDVTPMEIRALEFKQYKRNLMTDQIKAAFISGGFQIISAIIAILVAALTFNAWRRSTLGNKKIELAEKCLLDVWKLDKKIKETRMLAMPLPVADSNSELPPAYLERRKNLVEQAFNDLQECKKILEEFRENFLLAEFYLGALPGITFNGETRFAKKVHYSVPQEYDEIIRQLRVCLLDSNPDLFPFWSSDSSLEKMKKQAHLFNGFMYEYEEDEYSVRLRRVKKFLERSMRDVVQPKGLMKGAALTIRDALSDRYDNKFKPVVINKYADWKSSPAAKKNNSKIASIGNKDSN